MLKTAGIKTIQTHPFEMAGNASSILHVASTAQKLLKGPGKMMKSVYIPSYSKERSSPFEVNNMIRRMIPFCTNRNPESNVLKDMVLKHRGILVDCTLGLAIDIDSPHITFCVI